jgi:hypothetical protein
MHQTNLVRACARPNDAICFEALRRNNCDTDELVHGMLLAFSLVRDDVSVKFFDIRLYF